VFDLGLHAYLGHGLSDVLLDQMAVVAAGAKDFDGNGHGIDLLDAFCA
jgi:hypothetical protein